MRLLHRVCPPLKRRKLQPQGVTSRSNPAVKLLTVAPHVQDEGDTRSDDGDNGSVGLATENLADLATDNDTVVLENLESSEEDKVLDDDDFQPELTRKAPKKNYDNRRKF